MKSNCNDWFSSILYIACSLPKVYYIWKTQEGNQRYQHLFYPLNILKCELKSSCFFFMAFAFVEACTLKGQNMNLNVLQQLY